MDYKKYINGHECHFKVTCLKYSRISRAWVFFAKGLRRQTFPISEHEAELLLRQQTFTRHIKGNEILFQMNRNMAFYSPTSVEIQQFDLQRLL